MHAPLTHHTDQATAPLTTPLTALTPPTPLTPPSPSKGGGGVSQPLEALSSQPASVLVKATAVAAELLRTALLAKRAVDLQDSALAGRAARYAASSAHLLAGLDVPTYDDSEDVDDQELPEVDDLLERMPSRAEVEA